LNTKLFDPEFFNKQLSNGYMIVEALDSDTRYSAKETTRETEIWKRLLPRLHSASYPVTYFSKKTRVIFFKVSLKLLII